MKLITISLALLTIANCMIAVGMESNKRSYQQNRIYTPAEKKPCVPCPICNRMFKNPGVLETHLLTHDMTRTFKCTICREGFVSEKGLLTHKGTNTHKIKEVNARKNPIASAAAELLLELSAKKS